MPQLRRIFVNCLLICYFLWTRAACFIVGNNHLIKAISKNKGRIAIGILKIGGATIGSRLSLRCGLVIDNSSPGKIDEKLKNIKIGNNVFIGNGVFFDIPSPIVLEDDVVISAKAAILTHSDCGERELRKYYHRREGAVTVGRGSWIGFGAIILPGVRIGRCCIIGAGAVVTKDVADFTVVGGIPASAIKAVTIN